MADISDVSKLSDVSQSLSGDDCTDDIDISSQINQCIHNMNDSATYLNCIDSSVFGECFAEQDEIYTAVKIVDDYNANDYVVWDDDNDDDYDDDGYDDDDYNPSQSESSSDDIPLSKLSKKIIVMPEKNVHENYNMHEIPENIPSTIPSQDTVSDPCSLATSQDPLSHTDEPLPNEGKVSRSRKRKRDPSTWRRNIAKRRRNAGNSYVDRAGRARPGRVMKKGCGDGCRFKCSSKFSETDRENIFHSFWKLEGINKQRQFLSSHALKKSKKVKSTSFSRRTSSIIWHMPSSEGNSTKVRVCKTFFLGTLGISDKMITTAHRKLSIIGLCEGDQRGRHMVRPNRVEEQSLEMVRAHIKSFRTVESHYCRVDSDRLYLPSCLSISKMHRIYRAKCLSEGVVPVSESKYRLIFNTEFNLSFHRPKKDQCDFCTSYENASAEESCDRHMKNKTLARENKERDKMRAKTEQNSNTIVCCFDLEQILLTPHSFQSSLYYKRRLSSFNFTIYDLASTDGFCYLWNETVAKRGACEVASCLHQFLRCKSIEGAKKFIFYSDNCSAQNKNRFYVSMLWYCMSKYKLDSIVHKYLEKGHTQNEGDSIHSSVERASRNIPVYTTGQWATVIRTARHTRPYKVIEMTLNDFFDFKHLAKTIKKFDTNTDNQKVSWNSIKVLKFDSSAPNQFQYQTDYNGPVFTVELFFRSRYAVPNACKIGLEVLRNQLIELPSDKYLDLLHLCHRDIIPRAYHNFYLLLPHVDE